MDCFKIMLLKGIDQRTNEEILTLNLQKKLENLIAKHYKSVRGKKGFSRRK